MYWVDNNTPYMKYLPRKQNEVDSQYIAPAFFNWRGELVSLEFLEHNPHLPCEYNSVGKIIWKI